MNRGAGTGECPRRSCARSAPPARASRAPAACPDRSPFRPPELSSLIPAAGEIPILQTLIAYGLGVGPAAALLTTLPAVSLPSLVMLSTSLPPRALAFLGVTVPVLGVQSGAVAVAFGF